MVPLEKSTILVTGAAGFIGSHLCDALLEKGARVVALDNLSTGSLENLKDAKHNDSFTFVQADANKKEDLEPVFEKHTIDYVFHYAAVLGVKRVLEEPLSVLCDIEGFKNLMALCKKHAVKKVVYASSSEAYGDTKELPLSEDGTNLLDKQRHDTNLYSLVKLIGERVMQVYSKTCGVQTCSLRFFNVFGPRQESSAYGFVVGIFIKQIIDGQPPVIFGDGYQTRDFIYVKDNVRIAIQALLSEKTNGHVINVGVGRQTTIRDLAERLIRISGKDLKPIFEKERGYEIRYRTPDVTKMRSLIGVEIDDMIDKHLAETYQGYERKNNA